MKSFSRFFGAAAVAASLLGPQQTDAGSLDSFFSGDIGRALEDAGKKAVIKAGEKAIDRGAQDLMKGKSPIERYTDEDGEHQRRQKRGESQSRQRAGSGLNEGKAGEYDLCSVLRRASNNGILQCSTEKGFVAWVMDRPVQQSGSVGACEVPARGHKAFCDFGPVPLNSGSR